MVPPRWLTEGTVSLEKGKLIEMEKGKDRSPTLLVSSEEGGGDQGVMP